MLMYAHIPTHSDSILISLNEHQRDFWSLENVEPQNMHNCNVHKEYIQKRIAPYEMF